MIRQEFRKLVETNYDESEIFSREGREKLNQIRNSYRKIRGSYFGMLQGRYPMHLISEKEIPPHLFLESDEIRYKIFSYDKRSWLFAPIAIDSHSPNYFELEFNLPKEIASIMNNISDRKEIANLKRDTFSYIDISGKIGPIQRMVKLRLDKNWLSQFLESIG